MEKNLLEICCGSTDDVLAAYKGGADRVELNSDLFHGGLTPSVGALIHAKRLTPMPVLCMVRPREGGFCYTENEFAVMLEDTRMLLANGADGIVFGCLTPEGLLDIPRCKRMLYIIGDKPSVFHRAIDVVPDPLATLDALISLGVTRVLTSGQAPTVPQGVAMIRRMLGHAAGRIEILPGGGIDLASAAWVRAQTGVTMLHVAAHQTAYDRSAMGNPSIYFGGAIYPPEDRYLTGDEAAIRAFREAVDAQA